MEENIISKIQKLINMQEGAASVGNLAEAEAFGAKVQEILMKYNLDMDKVQAGSIQQRAQFFDGWIDLSGKQDKRESFWVPKLYSAIADNNLCRTSCDNDSIYILGRKDQVELVLYICDQMIAKVRIAEGYAWKEYNGDEKRGTFRRGFFNGATHGIRGRLKMEKQRDANPYAVMIVSRESELDLYTMWGTIDPMEIAKKKARRDEIRAQQELAWKELQLKLSKMTPKELKAWEKANHRPKVKYRYSSGPRQLSSNDGYTHGVKAGSNMSINHGVNSQSPKGNIS